MKISLPAMLIILSALAGSAIAQATQPSAGGFVIQHWAVWVVDATQNQLNPDGVFAPSVPEFVNTHRQTAASDASAPPNAMAGPRVVRMVANGAVMTFVQNGAVKSDQEKAKSLQSQTQPQPIGVIRVLGQADSKVDVALTKTNGDFVASWPEAQVRSRQLLWRDLSISDSPPATLRAVHESHWFNLLRSGAGDYLSNEQQAERFLLYDLEMPYSTPLKAKSGKDFSAQISNVSDATLGSLMLYQGDHGAWRSADIGDMLPQAATTRPTTSPSGSVRLTLGPTTQPSDLAEAWKPKLAAAGLNDADCQYIVNTIAAYAFDPRRLTAVYLMADREFDRVASLEVVPPPAKTVRLAVVIILNADPTLGSEVDDLITQLGDPAWPTRDAAYKALEKIGTPAIAKLQAATSNKDLEIVWRSERLLTELRGPSGQ